MNHTTLRCLLVVASAAALTASASAQLLNNATSTATSVRPVVPPAPPPPAPRTVTPPTVTPPAVNVSSAAQSAASAAATVRAPIVPPAQAATATAGTVGATVSTSATQPPTVVGSANASATGQLHGAAGLNVAATHGINATVNTAETTAAIQQTAFAARDQLSADLHAQIDASARALLDAKARADAAGDQTRAEFTRAMREVRAAEKEFRSALKTAVKTTKESTWGEVQSQLARDYSAYAEAVLAAEAAANGDASVGQTPATTEPPKS